MYLCNVILFTKTVQNEKTTSLLPATPPHLQTIGARFHRLCYCFLQCWKSVQSKWWQLNQRWRFYTNRSEPLDLQKIPSQNKQYFQSAFGNEWVVATGYYRCCRNWRPKRPKPILLRFSTQKVQLPLRALRLTGQAGRWCGITLSLR